MGVVFHLLGELVVDDEGEPLDINAPSGDVGGDEELGALFLKGAHDGVALLLGEVALEDIHGKSLGGELFTEDDGSGLGAAEDDTAVIVLALEKSGDEGGFLVAAANGELVVNVAVDDVGLVDFELMGLGRHAVLDEAVNGVWDGGGEEPGAFPGTGEAEDFEEFFFEAHAEHFIRLIEHEVLHMDEGEGLFLDQVDQASGRGNDDVGRALEGGDLAVEVVAAAEDFDEDFLGKLGVAEELLGDLLGQLAGGGDDQSLDFRGLRVHLHEQGQAKSCGFSGAGLRLGDEVAAVFKQEGDGFFLDFRGNGDAESLEALDEISGDAEFFECFQWGCEEVVSSGTACVEGACAAGCELTSHENFRFLTT